MSSAQVVKIKKKKPRQFSLGMKAGKFGKFYRPDVKLFRSGEPLIRVFMWGINHTINQLANVRMPALLMTEDFNGYSKVKVDNHLFNKDAMPSHFKIKEYCPLVFRYLREKFGVDDNDYLASLTKAEPSKYRACGRSGARFLLSWDERYCIKVIQSEEIGQLHTMLANYHRYVVETDGATRLPHYMGCYRLTVNDQETYMLVMRNVFSPRLVIHKKYDLKGSTVDRFASEKEKSKDLPTFKDNDFIADGVNIIIGAEQKTAFIKIIEKDVAFLSANNLMDYSLLVGVHDVCLGNTDLDDTAGDELGADDEVGDEFDVGGAADQVNSSDNELVGSASSPAVVPDGAGVPLDFLLEPGAGERLDITGGDDLPVSLEADLAAAGGEGDDEDGIVGPVSPLTQSSPFMPYSGVLSQKYERFAVRSFENANSPTVTSEDLHGASVVVEEESRDPSASPPTANQNGFEGGTSPSGGAAAAAAACDRDGDPHQNYIYFMALIDILTPFGVKKRSALAAKTVKYGAGADISTVKPDQYGKRFLDFIDKCIK